jgi:hypothetical protein
VSPPRAFPVSGPLPATTSLTSAVRLRAAFRSRLIRNPQCSQWNTLDERASLAFTVPQAEQVFDDGYHWSATRSTDPYQAVL